MRYAPVVTPEFRDEVLRLRSMTSLSQTDIAARLHVSHTTINEIFSEAARLDGHDAQAGQRNRPLLASTLPLLPSEGGRYDY